METALINTCGGSWILVECAASTVLTSCLKTTIIMVCFMLPPLMYNVFLSALYILFLISAPLSVYIYFCGFFCLELPILSNWTVFNVVSAVFFIIIFKNLIEICDGKSRHL